MKEVVGKITQQYGKDKNRLMDILLDVQALLGHIPREASLKIAADLGMSEVDVDQTVSFYHFFAQQPAGRYRIYLNNSVVANMMGGKEVASTFEKELGIRLNEVTPDGLVGLYETSCIGMNDQEPAVIINDRIFTRLTPFRVKEIIRDIKEGRDIDDMIVAAYGDGENSSDLIRSVVSNNIRKIGPVLKRNFKPGEAIEKILSLTPEEVIEEIKISNVRGRGGAGFPTGIKMEFCRNIPADKRYVFCNADEGEPGTFKDRVILTEHPRLLIEGMVIVAYAVGAQEGIIYVRYEYKYLQQYLESVLKESRNANLLGNNILGKKDFNFDIRIQYGAGAYVCGEESALIESVEGKRGEPRDRPPFPVRRGYFYKPTVVKNVETFCTIAKVILHGTDWFKSFGTVESTGTKLLSISGDCKFPGIYEVEWGISITDILEMVGADKEDVQAIQVGGPSGIIISQEDFNRILGYEDLTTGGSMIIIGRKRDILNDVVLNFTEFFIEESCGSCSTCRIVPSLLRNKLLKILNGRGVKKDIDDILEWGKILRASRCGLGQTAANPILSSLKNFRHLYDEKIQKNKEFDTGFDLNHAIKESCQATGRILIT